VTGDPGEWDRPVVVVVDGRNHRRLALVDHLRGAFVPEGLPPGPDLLRVLRGRQPSLVLILVRPWNPGEARRTCHWLKTDARPVERVALLNPDGPRLDPASVLQGDLADGYWEGDLPPAEVEAFALDVWQGRRPVVVRPRTGLLARWFGG
jgi:hypothetical protein